MAWGQIAKSSRRPAQPRTPKASIPCCFLKRYAGLVTQMGHAFFLSCRSLEPIDWYAYAVSTLCYPWPPGSHLQALLSPNQPLWDSDGPYEASDRYPHGKTSTN